MIKLPEFIKRAAERAIHDATHPTGMHTNGPAMARIEVSQLNALQAMVRDAPRNARRSEHFVDVGYCLDSYVE